MMTDEDLVHLHNRWLGQLDEMVRAGVDHDAACEAMLTIAVTGRMQVDGPRATAARLALIAGMLEGLANQRAVDGATDDKTRH